MLGSAVFFPPYFNLFHLWPEKKFTCGLTFLGLQTAKNKIFFMYCLKRVKRKDLGHNGNSRDMLIVTFCSNISAKFVVLWQISLQFFKFANCGTSWTENLKSSKCIITYKPYFFAVCGPKQTQTTGKIYALQRI